jgi:hypothetical protein
MSNLMRVFWGLCWVVSTQSALAFPTWMGVYGKVVRHNDPANPGVFTILMNQDYYGLKARVGIQVNSGAWTEYSMSYAGNMDGNSKWQYTPSAFPEGATVNYYFRGVEGAQNIYDSNNSRNYTFSVPGREFGSRQKISDVTDSGALAGYGNMAYIVQAGRDFRFARRDSAATNFYGWKILETNTFGFYGYGLAASQHDVVAAAVSAPTGTLRIYTSHDQGMTFTQTNTITLDVNEAVHSVDVCHAGGSTFIVALDSGINGSFQTNMKLIRSTDKGNTWSAPVLVDRASYAIGNPYVCANAEGIFISYITYTDQGESHLVAAFSVDGNNWTSTNLVTASSVNNIGMIDIVATSNQVIVARNKLGSVSSWRRVGGSWAMITNMPAMDTRPIFGSIDLTAKPDGKIYVFQSVDNSHMAYLSTGDGGISWSGLTQTNHSTISLTLQSVAAQSGVIHVLWSGNPPGGEGSYLQSSVRPEFGWVGDTYNWPVQGQVSNQTDFWVNTETWPMGSVVSAYVIYSTNGVNWLAFPMSIKGSIGNNDGWHANLGKFASGTAIQYAILTVDAKGVSHWDTNDSRNYKAKVN